MQLIHSMKAPEVKEYIKDHYLSISGTETDKKKLTSKMREDILDCNCGITSKDSKEDYMHEFNKKDAMRVKRTALKVIEKMEDDLAMVSAWGTGAKLKTTSIKSFKQRESKKRELKKLTASM